MAFFRFFILTLADLSRMIPISSPAVQVGAVEMKGDSSCFVFFLNGIFIYNLNTCITNISDVIITFTLTIY